MQRYEKEIEEILRGLNWDYTPDPGNDEGKPTTSRNVVAEAPPLQSIDVPPARRPARSPAGRFVWSTCFLLASALVLMPFASLLSAGLIALSLVLLLVLLRRGRLERDGAARDLRWKDITRQPELGAQGTPGMPRSLGDFMSWPK